MKKHFFHSRAVWFGIGTIAIGIYNIAFANNIPYGIGQLSSGIGIIAARLKQN